MSGDDPSPDLMTTLLRLLVGSVVVGSDLTLGALLSAAEGRATEDGDAQPPLAPSTALRARQALIGLLFEAYGDARRGISTAGRAVSTAGRLWRAVARPIVRSRAMDPVRRPYEFLVGRGSEELDRWAEIGRTEEDRSREVVRRLSMAPVEEIVSYLRANPELERLVRRQAESLLRQLEDDPALTAVVREQGDRYVEHIREHPEAIQELVRGQSVGMAAELADTVRRRTVIADAWLERLVRAVLGRTPREELPGPSPEVRAHAAPQEPTRG